MAAGDRAKKKISERAEAFIASSPGPGEPILAGAQDGSVFRYELDSLEEQVAPFDFCPIKPR